MPLLQVTAMELIEGQIEEGIEAVIVALRGRRLLWDAVHPHSLTRFTPDPALLRRLVMNGWHRTRNEIPDKRGALSDVRFYDPPPPAARDPRQLATCSTRRDPTRRYPRMSSGPTLIRSCRTCTTPANVYGDPARTLASDACSVRRAKHAAPSPPVPTKKRWRDEPGS